MIKRDKTIDQLRGLATLWVIVVHVFYWGNFFNNSFINLFKSFFLFEMPLFFFITGACNNFTRICGYFNFVYKRYKRVLIPYWTFAIICTILSIVFYSITDKIDIHIASKILLSWLIPIDQQITSIPYLTWALWFIPVYLCVILLIPLLKLMKQSSKQILFFFILLIIFVATCIFKMGWIQNITFYSLWTYIGLFYDIIICNLNKPSFRKKISSIILFGATTILVLHSMGKEIDMQYNKFPPNITFCIFSFAMMALIILSIPYINKIYTYIKKYKPIKKIINLFSTHSMTIFLYQVFAFNITIHFSNFLITGDNIIISIIKSTLCLITTLPICAVLAHIFGKFENKKIKLE